MANALLVYRFLDEYCDKLLGKRGKILHAELVDASLFEMSVESRLHGSWQCGPDQFAIASFDMESKERANTIVDKAKSPLTLYRGLDRHLGMSSYLVGHDVVLVECSCTYDITQLLNEDKSEAVGNHLQFWRNNNPELRVPVALEFGSTCTGMQAEIASDQQEARTRERMRLDYIQEIQAVAEEHGVDWTQEPQAIPHADELRDGTLEACQEDVDTFGATRVFGNLDDATFVPDPFPLRVLPNNVLLIVARVALLQGPEVRPGELIYFPRVTRLILANAFGTVLVEHLDVEGAGIYPGGYEEARPGMRKGWRHMRSSVIEYMGKSGVLVGFSMSWILTALQLPVNAARVIDIGMEPAYQRWCRQLATSRDPRLAEPHDAEFGCTLRLAMACGAPDCGSGTDAGRQR